MHSETFAVLFAGLSFFILREISLKADTKGMILQNKSYMTFPLGFSVVLFIYLFIHLFAQLWIIEASGKKP